MTSQAPINIHEYRLGDPPAGLWRYAYDPYTRGRPVPEASEEAGRPVFAAYRTQAPDTVPIYRHRYTYAEPNDPNLLRSFTPEAALTQVCFELDERPPEDDRFAPPAGPLGVDSGGFFGRQVPYGEPASRRAESGIRVFWAFPAASAGSAPGSVPVHEHRLEVDMLTEYRFAARGRVPSLQGRCLVYLRYSIAAEAGRVFDGEEDARDLAAPAAWWRWMRDGSNPQPQPHAYARYSRRVAFYAYPPQ